MGVLRSAGKSILFPENSLGDLLYTVRAFRQVFGRWPNLARPQTFNERLLALMLSHRASDPLRQKVSDKEFVKDYIRSRVGDQYNVKTLAVLPSLNEALAFPYPLDCVVKPTHMSGQVIIRRRGTPPVGPEKLRGWFSTDYYRVHRERNYRKLQAKVIVEERLEEPEAHDVPSDYKLFCFRGTPAFVQVDATRFAAHRRSIFSTNWNRLPFTIKYPPIENEVPSPHTLPEMICVARRLSSDFDFIRVDLYSVAGTIKVGELSNFPEAGLGAFVPARADLLAGQLFESPDIDVERHFSSLAY